VGEQAAAQHNLGMLPAQHAALSFAWMVLKAIDEQEAAAAKNDMFCTPCGARQTRGRCCGNRGARY
jgi:hypothetical protein